jgi:predicted RNA-binding Zn-ribbon protein involved in translation (DUF1610 family)
MDPKRVVVAAFGNILEAHLAQSRLQNEGIDAIVDDEFTVNANNLLDVAVGGVKILVPETEAGRAGAILSARPAADAASPAPPDDTVPCPRCGSTDVHRPERPRRIAFLMAMLFGFPAWFGLRKWKCSRCGHEWKPEASPHPGGWR